MKTSAKTKIIPRRKDARRDPHDGTCTVCGECWPDRRETLEAHVCPPGFRTSPVRRGPRANAEQERAAIATLTKALGMRKSGKLSDYAREIRIVLRSLRVAKGTVATMIDLNRLRRDAHSSPCGRH